MEQLDALRLDCAIKQKRGLHIILASILIWLGVMVVHLTALPIATKNFLTFCCTAPLLPLSLLFSKLIKVDFQNKGNPLMKLGILFTVNQMLYLLIAMWVYAVVPEKLVMVMAMIFGAHLMPYSWLYRSKLYMILSIAIPIGALLLGLFCEPYVLAMAMAACEILFSIGLIVENRDLKKAEPKI